MLSANTLVVAGGATLVATFFGLPSALLLYRFHLPGKTLLRSAQVVPLVVPPFITAIGWLHLGSETGALNHLLNAMLQRFGLSFDPYSLASPAWVLGLSGYPLVSLVTSAALEQLNPELSEAARIEGARLARFVSVTLPLITPALARGMLLAFLLAVSDFAVPSFFSVNVYTVELFIRFGAFYDYRSGVLIALPLLALTLVVFLVQHLLIKGWPTDADAAPNAPNRPIDAGRWKWAISLALALPAILAVVFPLAALAYRSPELRDYQLAWNVAHEEVMNSIALASLSASLACIGGLLIAWVLVRSNEAPWTNIIEALTLGALAVPGLVLGIGLIRLWNRGVPLVLVYQSFWIVVLAMATRAIPLASVAIASAWRNLPRIYEEEAIVHGAAWRQSFYRVLLPLLRPGLAGAWTLAYAFSITELQATLLVYPPGYGTLPIRIYTLQHDGQPENVAALCLILVLVTLAPVSLLWWLVARWKEE
jgi:iron(III) transport system permease protein